MTDPTTELRRLLDRFVSGEDASLKAANRLEVLLEEAFPDDDVVQDRVGDLAQYRPGGGEFLFDEKECAVASLASKDTSPHGVDDRFPPTPDIGKADVVGRRVSRRRPGSLRTRTSSR
ncbi:hypothetical protein [Sphingomonas sp. RS2018]